MRNADALTGRRNGEPVRRGIQLTLVIAALALAPGTARGLTRAIALDEELASEEIRVQSIADGRIRYFDAERVLRTAALDRFLRLRFLADAPAPRERAGAPPLRLTLVNGERLAVRARSEGASGTGGLAVAHPLLGKLAVPIERIRGLRRDGPPIAPSEGRDRIRLVNGDLVTGVVLGVRGRSVRIQRIEAGDRLDLPIRRVSALGLANQRASPEAALLQLADGERLAVRDVRLTGETLRARAARNGARLEIPVARARRLEVATRARGLLRLERLDWRVAGGGSVFGAPWRPRRPDGGGLTLHAPVALAVDLPPNARRFAARLALARTRELTAWHRRWANVSVRVTVDGERVATGRLRGGGSGALELNAKLEGARLRLILEPGVNGPVMDRVRLRDAIVLVEPAPANRDE